MVLLTSFFNMKTGTLPMKKAFPTPIGGENILHKEKVTNLGEDLLQTIARTSVVTSQSENTKKMPQILGQPSGGWPLILQCFC